MKTKVYIVVGILASMWGEDSIVSVLFYANFQIDTCKCWDSLKNTIHNKSAGNMPLNDQKYYKGTSHLLGTLIYLK